jgi:hypothetical protein
MALTIGSFSARMETLSPRAWARSMQRACPQINSLSQTLRQKDSYSQAGASSVTVNAPERLSNLWTGAKRESNACVSSAAADREARATLAVHILSTMA